MLQFNLEAAYAMRIYKKRNWYDAELFKLANCVETGGFKANVHTTHQIIRAVTGNLLYRACT